MRFNAAVAIWRMVLLTMISRVTPHPAAHHVTGTCNFICGQGLTCRYIYTVSGLYTPACIVSDGDRPVEPSRPETNERTDRLSRGLAEALNAIYRGHRPPNVRNQNVNGIVWSTAAVPVTRLGTTGSPPFTQTPVGSPDTPGQCTPCTTNDACLLDNQFCFFSPICAYRTCQIV